MALWESKILLLRIDRHKFKKIKKSLFPEMGRLCLYVIGIRSEGLLSAHFNYPLFPCRKVNYSQFNSVKPSVSHELKQELKPPSALVEDLYV